MLPLISAIINTFFLVGYVSNANSFPQPLQPEEEQKYVQMYKDGSEEARNILIERNLRLVAHIVKKYSSSGNDCDDLISIGTIGLIKAISTFDNSKGTRLATYAARCIENAILLTRKHFFFVNGFISFIILMANKNDATIPTSSKWFPKSRQTSKNKY